MGAPLQAIFAVASALLVSLDHVAAQGLGFGKGFGGIDIGGLDFGAPQEVCGTWEIGKNLDNAVALSDVTVASRGECLALCEADYRCIAITFEVHNNKCWTRSAFDGLKTDHRKMSFVLCPPECGTVVPGMTLVGDKLPGFPGDVRVKSMDECVRACERTEGCEAGAFQANRGWCWLRKNVRRLRSHPHRESMVLCPVEKPALAPCGTVVPGKTLIGDKLPGFPGDVRVKTLDACVKACSDTEGCEASAFQENRGLCWLRRNIRGFANHAHRESVIQCPKW